MRVQFLNPPTHHYDGGWYRMNPALGMPILAAVLEGAGHEAQVVDAEALRASPEAIGASFKAQRERWPDVVGLTVTTHNARGARETIAAIRAAGYDRRIMLGGPHITLLGRGNIDEQDCWGADVWVTGECEGNIVDIVESDAVGLVDGKQAPIEDIPAPLWTKHTPTPMQYMGNMPHVGKPEGISMWSRGCPGACTFCGNPVFGRQAIRTRPPENVYEDMRQLKELGARAVFVYDDELVGTSSKRQTDWLHECCEWVAPLELHWKAQGRCTVNTAPETLKIMADAGCKAIMWGVESFSQPVLDAMKKNTTEADIWHTLRAAKAAGIKNWVFLMVGNAEEGPSELAYTAKQLAEAVKEGLVQYRQVTVCTPVPGTPLYDRAKAEGWLCEPPEGGPQMAQVYNATPWLKEREIKHWKTQLEGAGL